ncbi:MAG: acyl-CoA dehydrogenase family protein [Rhodospirillales bacterium]
MPPDIVDDMKQLGLFGLSIPEQYGGLGLSMEDEVLACMELAAPAWHSDPYSETNVGIGSQGLLMFGTDAQKQRFLPGIASGEITTSSRSPKRKQAPTPPPSAPAPFATATTIS